jgi:CubicO group peptidase (beta-lactamase class C family)
MFLQKKWCPKNRVELNSYSYIIICLIVGTVLFFCLSGTTFASDSANYKDLKERTARIDTYVQTVMDRFDIPGLTAAVVQHGHRIYTAAFGVRNIQTREPMKAEYIFHMASVSKPFVATAVMQLVEEGKMDLDEKVVTYLPYFKLADEQYKEITIRQMLNHTSGMPDVQDYEWDKPQYDEGAAERYVRSLKNEKMLFAPGEKWRYSNMAFDVLGDVIAKVSGQSFESYVKEYILNPLEMYESSFLKEDIKENLRTSPHIWEFGPVYSEIYPYNRPHAPSSTLNSSVIEMTNWITANLNHGEFKGKRILKAESYDLLWKPSAQVDENRQIGLSWFLQTHRGISIISHGGGDRGYRSHIYIVPEKNMGLILASNYDQTPMGEIANGVLDILLGHEPDVPKKPIGFKFAEVCHIAGVDSAKKFYEHVYTSDQEEYNFAHWELNRVGYYFLGKEKIDLAINIFKYNVELYPEEANTYDSLGEAYMIAGQNKLAIKNYEKSLELNPDNMNAVQMLKKIRRD